MCVYNATSNLFQAILRRKKISSYLEKEKNALHTSSSSSLMIIQLEFWDTPVN